MESGWSVTHKPVSYSAQQVNSSTSSLVPKFHMAPTCVLPHNSRRNQHAVRPIPQRPRTNRTSGTHSKHHEGVGVRVRACERRLLYTNQPVSCTYGIKVRPTICPTRSKVSRWQGGCTLAFTTKRVGHELTGQSVLSACTTLYTQLGTRSKVSG